MNKDASFPRKAGSFYEEFILSGLKMYKLKKQKLFRNIILSCFIGILLCGQTVEAAPRVQPLDDELVIVIDPGHGGENLGTIENGFVEKEMTLTTAMAMYEELSKYEDVTIYMTRTTDVDLDLKERAEFAQSVNADFLFSIHYNASLSHTLYGSEVWISNETPYNAYGYQFGYTQMQNMEDLGLFIRGVKTRLGDKGDYYGIIRESVALSIPAVIIEHCSVDEPRDIPFCDDEKDLIAFGKADATSVAQYFGLKSTELNVDYSEYSSQLLPEASANKRVTATLVDNTEPDICTIELQSIDLSANQVTIKVTATDYDTPLMYYSISTDGGETFSSLYPWPDGNVLKGLSKDTFTLEVDSDGTKDIIFRAYNLYDLDTDSNPITAAEMEYMIGRNASEDIAQADSDTKETEVTSKASEEYQSVIKEHKSLGTTTFLPANADDIIAEEEYNVDFLDFLMLCLVVVVILLMIVIASQLVNVMTRKKRRQRRNPLGDNKYHKR